MFNENYLTAYIENPEDDLTNYDLAIEYDNNKQYASALSFYLRCADRTKVDDIKYLCFVRMGIIFQNLGNRNMSSKFMFQKAISLIPNFSCAYIYLSKLHENCIEYNDSYTLCNISLSDNIIYDMVAPDLYYQRWKCIFQKAISSYWCNSAKESRYLLKLLLNEYWEEMDDEHRRSVEENITRLGIGPEEISFVPYDKSLHNQLKYRFLGSDKIEHNHAQVMQDMFVLYMTYGKKRGTFLEIGGGPPFKGNNTALLEQNYNWKGVSIEYDSKFIDNYNKERPNTTVYQLNALEIDYSKFLKANFDDNVIDYLQLDIEPAKNTLECLKKIPFDEFKFRVITFEHDNYIDTTKNCKKLSREYLVQKGYVLIIHNVSPDGINDFEDWWVHPKLVDTDTINKIKINNTLNSTPTNIKTHFYNNYECS